MEVEQVLYMLMVKDMERAVDFYTNVIGFRRRSVEPRWSELAFGDFTLALHIEEGGSREQKRTGLSFTVRNLDAACREVEAAGGKVITPPHEAHIEGLRLAVVADSESNNLELGEHTR